MGTAEEEEEEEEEGGGGWKGIEGARFESGLFLFVFSLFFSPRLVNPASRHQQQCPQPQSSTLNGGQSVNLHLLNI